MYTPVLIVRFIRPPFGESSICLCKVVTKIRSVILPCVVQGCSALSSLLIDRHPREEILIFYDSIWLKTRNKNGRHCMCGHPIDTVHPFLGRLYFEHLLDDQNGVGGFIHRDVCRNAVSWSNSVQSIDRYHLHFLLILVGLLGHRIKRPAVTLQSSLRPVQLTKLKNVSHFYPTLRNLRREIRDWRVMIIRFYFTWTVKK